MIARIRKSIEEKDKGFTLIELLVVMIIIGILAAIAIPVFLNQRKKANDTAAVSDVSTLGKEVATYYVDATTVLAAGSFTLNPYAIGSITNIGKTSNNVTSAALTYPNGTSADVTNASTAWCVTIIYSGWTISQWMTSRRRWTHCPPRPRHDASGAPRSAQPLRDLIEQSLGREETRPAAAGVGTGPGALS